MTKRKSPPGPLSPQEVQLIEELREHPDLMERFQTILQISSNAEGPIKRADEVEVLLIAELRRLGNTTMGKLGFAGRGAAGQAIQRRASAGSCN